MTEERCSWCDASVEPDDGFRLAESPGERQASFCRLEHVVPWAISGPHWAPGQPVEPPGIPGSAQACVRCEAPLNDVSLVLVRHRGEHRIPDGFCSVAHLREWAQAGGRYA